MVQEKTHERKELVMKLSCEVYEDLLLLYEEGMCSEESKRLVEEHLAGCDRCKEYLNKMRLPEELIQEEQEEQAVLSRQKEKSKRNLTEAERVQKSFRKIKRRWALSLAVLPSLLVLLGLGIMVADEVRGEGLAFSNLYDFWVSGRFVRLVDKGEYEKAAEMLDYSDSYQSLIQTLSEEDGEPLTEESRQFYMELFGDVLNMTYEEYAKQERQKIVNYLQEEDAMNRIRHYGYGRAYRHMNHWQVGLEIVERVKEPDIVGREELNYTLFFWVTGNGQLQVVGASVGNPGFLKDENGELLYDENGDRIMLWIPSEQFALDGAFFRNFTRDVWWSGENLERSR